jgi:hypothetical protein
MYTAETCYTTQNDYCGGRFPLVRYAVPEWRNTGCYLTQAHAGSILRELDSNRKMDRMGEMPHKTLRDFAPDFIVLTRRNLAKAAAFLRKAES